MPRVTFSEENKAASTFDFPRLQLQMNERARIVLMEDPLMEYVHSLRAPQLVNGKAQYEMVNKFGKDVEEMKTDFIAQYICLGDLNVLDKKGLDADACPMCAAASKSDAIEPPKRRFSANIVKYKTVPGSFQVQEPYSAEVLVWSFTDKRFNQISDFHTEWGDLRTHDMLLGPCVNKQFQTFDLSIAAKAEWNANEERAKHTVGLFKANALDAERLSSMCGRKGTRDKVEEDVDRVLVKYRQAHNTPSDDAPSMEEAVEELNLDDLLAPAPEPVEEEAPKVKKTAAKKVEPVFPEPETVQAEPAESLDFNDLLADLA